MTDTIAIAMLAAVPPTLMALGALIQTMKTHKAVNSRMDELLDITRQQAGEQATLKEKSAQKGREADAVIDKAKHDTKP